MENKSSKQIICRKCGGPHFTIKCGKTTEPVKETKKETILEQSEKPSKQYNKTNYNRQQNNDILYTQGQRKKTYCVKLSELPLDMTEEEMMELTYEWGHIHRIKVLNYKESSTAYIDFGFEDEAKYFVEAIDRTPFESVLLFASQV